MSEYQCYEFLAIDRPLTADEIASLREISSRAEISPTRFWNEYSYGDFRGVPEDLVARYFDLHCYFANWGARRLMIRVPLRCIDHEPLDAYFGGESASLARKREYAIFDLQSDLDEPEYVSDEVSLGSLAPLRAELMNGDRRLAYLAWLLELQYGDIDEETQEPPVPPGLGDLSASLEAMIGFLRLDGDLVDAAAEASAPLTMDTEAFGAWVRALPAKTKDEWLLRAVQEPGLALGGQLLRAFRATQKTKATQPKRTVARLRARAEEIAQARLRAETQARKQAKENAQRKRLAGFNALAKRSDAAWKELEAFIEKNEYLEALRVAGELHDLAIHLETVAAFDERLDALRKRYLGTRRGFFIRWGRQRRLRAKS